MNPLNDPQVREAGARAVYRESFGLEQQRDERARDWDQNRVPDRYRRKCFLDWDRIAAEIAPLLNPEPPTSDLINAQDEYRRSQG